MRRCWQPWQKPECPQVRLSEFIFQQCSKQCSIAHRGHPVSSGFSACVPPIPPLPDLHTVNSMCSAAGVDMGTSACCQAATFLLIQGSQHRPDTKTDYVCVLFVAGPILSTADIYREEQYRQRNMFETAAPPGGTISFPYSFILSLPHLLPHSLPCSLTHSLPHSFPPSLIHVLTHSLSSSAQLSSRVWHSGMHLVSKALACPN